MATGIQVLNKNGKVIFDAERYVMRVLGTIEVKGEGSITHPLITVNNFFVFPDNTNLEIPTDTPMGQVELPEFYVEGHTLNWYQSGRNNYGTFIYGVKI